MTMIMKLHTILSKNALFLAWIIALVATVESLFISEIMHIPACSLCWYQRIFMYPLVLVLGIGIFRKDVFVRSYAFTFAGIGFFIALYHTLLYHRIIPDIAPCSTGVSCAAPTPAFLGIFSIPLLSLMAFGMILVLLLASRTQHASA